MSLIPLTERSVPWSPFGHIFNAEDHVSTADMLFRAGLSGWDIQVENVPMPENYWTDTPLFWTTKQSGVNPIGRDVLSTVGKRYHALQNEELFAFGDGLLDGGEWVSAGSFKGGRVVFGTLKLHEGAEVAGLGMDNYLLVSTSHDGSLAIQASVTPINPVCFNTLIAAIKGAKRTFKIRHTQTLAGRMQAARETLELSGAYLDVWADVMRPLADVVVDDTTFEEIINREFGPGDEPTKNALTRWEKTSDELWDIWYGATVRGAGIGNTAFGLYNTLNEHHGWSLMGRGENATENAAAARSGFSPIWNAENDRLLAIAQSV